MVRSHHLQGKKWDQSERLPDVNNAQHLSSLQPFLLLFFALQPENKHIKSNSKQSLNLARKNYTAKLQDINKNIIRQKGILS